MNSRPPLLALLALAAIHTTSAFAPIPSVQQRRDATLLHDNKGDDKSAVVDEDMNPVTRASWYAVEAFGNIFGQAKDDDEATAEPNLAQAPASLQETLDRIQLDNDRSYFLSGQVDKLIYDPDCTFADPFVSFNGRDRFVDNLQNLGSFITKYSAKLLDYKVVENSEVQTRLMVKLELNLPWKPILAWPWGVRYEIDATSNLITVHEESWDIDPLEGVKQIFRKPTTQIKE